MILVGLVTVEVGVGQSAPAGIPDRVRVPAGRFVMGCAVGDSGCEAHERPRHEVRLTRDVWLTRTEITVGGYAAFIEATAYRTQADRTGRGRDWNQDKGEWEWVSGLTFRRPYADGIVADQSWPAVQVAWADADAYCRWAGGRLPTEAEWEYGARGGRDGEKFPWGDAPVPRVVGRQHANGPDEQNLRLFPRWDVFPGYDDGYARLAPVGTLAPNGFGLLDMAGNAWEWVHDWHQADYYRASPSDDPSGPASGVARVVRGGSWGYAPKQHRNSERGYAEPDFWTSTFGFRCAFDGPS